MYRVDKDRVGQLCDYLVDMYIWSFFSLWDYILRTINATKKVTFIEERLAILDPQSSTSFVPDVTQKNDHLYITKASDDYENKS